MMKRLTCDRLSHFRIVSHGGPVFSIYIYWLQFEEKPFIFSLLPYRASFRYANGP